MCSSALNHCTESQASEHLEDIFYELVKKTLLILLFGLLTNVTLSQDAKAIYMFKKERQRKMFKYSEIDSLVLYNNGSFYRKYFYQYHEIKYSVVKGNWKIENGVLYLNITERKESNAEENWTQFYGKFRYSILRKRIIPINDHFEIYATQKLKFIE